MVPPIEKGFTKKKKLFVQYPYIPSAIHPHGEGLLIPKAPESFVVESSEEEPQEACSDERTALHDTDYLPSTSAELHLITQMELNDLIGDLPKNKAEKKAVESPGK